RPAPRAIGTTKNLATEFAWGGYWTLPPMNHRPFSSLFAALFVLATTFARAADKPNVLIITVDDMSCDSVGVFGCRIEGTTPRIDQLATQCQRFTYAHSVVGNCMPSRNVMWSGRYPHNNHVEGFNPIPKEQANYPVMGDLMKAGGWFTGIRH